MQRPSSVPPTPSANESRSPNSSSSTQGSFTGSEIAINDIGLRYGRRIKPKVSSADSILAMLRNFTSTNVLSQMSSSLIISPSTTPSVSSPQDMIDDDFCDSSTTSSMHGYDKCEIFNKNKMSAAFLVFFCLYFRTPISYTSCAPDSPTSYHNFPNVSIEVPVLDPLNAHKPSANCASGNSQNPPTILLEVPNTNTKCLSPIRELPTPIPSPALTPIMSRPHKFTHYAHSSSSFHDRITSANISDDDERAAFGHSDVSKFFVEPHWRPCN